MANHKKVAKDILEIVKVENIISYTNCMTRLRLKAKPNFDIEKLKSLDGVIGLVKAGSDEFQIILGPGFVNKVTTEFSKLVESSKLSEDSKNLNNLDEFKSAKELGIEQKNKMRGSGSVRTFLSKISKVFTPLIPAFIAAGLLSGIAGILASSVDNNFAGHPTLQSWNAVLAISLTILTNVFIIVVGWRMAEEWGGNPGLGALVAAIYTSFAGTAMVSIFVAVNVDGTLTGYNFIGMFIPIDSIDKNWFSVGFVTYSYNASLDTKVASLGAPHAGLIGAMIAVGVTIQVEKGFRKFMPGTIDTILTPILVLFIMLFINFILIIPVAGYLFTSIAFLFEHLYKNPFGAAFLAGIFLIALAFGVHQGFLPVYFALMEQPGGVNGLFPIMTMGGAAQVGVAITMWFLAGKNSILRKQISGAIIPGFLGIGEPLIYGISLPRVKPFIIACIASAFGGFYIGAMNTWGGIGLGMNSPTGPGGLTAIIMMTTVDGNALVGMLVYSSGLLITYTLGALFCLFGYSKIARLGSTKTREIYKLENNQLTIQDRILYTLLFITIIGLFATWIYWYIKVPNEKREEIKNYKLV